MHWLKIFDVLACASVNHQVLNANGTPGENEQINGENIIEFKASNNTYVGTTRKWELKSQGPPSTLHCSSVLH